MIGAGATQAEIDQLGAEPVNLLMGDNTTGEGLSTRILKRSGAGARSFLVDDKGVDIEKLISLLGATGVAQHSELAEKMRRLYFEEVRRGLVKGGVISTPQLSTALLDLHRCRKFRQNVEVLSAILTTNHDGLWQVAFQESYGAVNVGFPVTSEDFDLNVTAAVPLLLQLHGSFTWSFGVPIEVRRLRRDSRYLADTVWLPPSIQKESKTHPFNKLIAMAYACLVTRCDVLRIIGSSMAQNDWNVLSLIFNAQRHREAVRKNAFRIELIMSQENGEAIQRQCSYLSGLTPICYLSEGNFQRYKDPPATHDPEMANAYAFWLKEKVTHHYWRREITLRDITKAMTAVSGVD